MCTTRAAGINISLNTVWQNKDRAPALITVKWIWRIKFCDPSLVHRHKAGIKKDGNGVDNNICFIIFKGFFVV